MKNEILTGLLAIGSIVLLSGCGKSAIVCDDGDAQKTVMEIVEKEMKSQLYNGMFRGQIRPSEGFTERAENESDLDIAYTKEAEKVYKESNANLSNIRTESMDNEIEKSECAAEVNFANGNKLDITYSLSKTTDGNLYAEVSGL